MEKNQTTKKPRANQPRLAAELMPQGVEAQHELLLRAQLFAKVEGTNSQGDGISYIRFGLGAARERYGIPYQFTKEIMNNVTLTKLPFVPLYIAGVINRRGALLAVIDLKQFFHTQVSDYNKDSYIIVVTANDMTIGILADSIDGRDVYEPTKLDPPFSLHDIIKPELIVGLHHGITAIINVEALMSSSELQIKK